MVTLQARCNDEVDSVLAGVVNDSTKSYITHRKTLRVARLQGEWIVVGVKIGHPVRS